MGLRQLAYLMLAPLLCGRAVAQGAASGTEDPLHAWAGAASAASIEHWVGQRLELAKQSINRLTSISGPRTVANTLAPYDEALNQLTTAQNAAGLLNAVHRDKAVRDSAQSLAQKVSSALTDLSLNQKVYSALSALDVSRADPATRHYLERTLLEYRLAGVDKDEAPLR